VIELVEVEFCSVNRPRQRYPFVRDEPDARCLGPGCDELGFLCGGGPSLDLRGVHEGGASGQILRETQGVTRRWAHPARNEPAVGGDDDFPRPGRVGIGAPARGDGARRSPPWGKPLPPVQPVEQGEELIAYARGVFKPLFLGKVVHALYMLGEGRLEVRGEGRLHTVDYFRIRGGRILVHARRAAAAHLSKGAGTRGGSDLPREAQRTRT